MQYIDGGIGNDGETFKIVICCRLAKAGGDKEEVIRCNAALALLQQASAVPAGTLIIARQSDGHPEVILRSSIGGPIAGKAR